MHLAGQINAKDTDPPRQLRIPPSAFREWTGHVLVDGVRGPVASYSDLVNCRALEARKVQENFSWGRAAIMAKCFEEDCSIL